jgi:hypothetical protein
MTSAERNFPLFSQLPTELRDTIWRECLPCRIWELDNAVPEIVYDVNKRAEVPCCFWHTAGSNTRPPVISRVCRESRAVAFENTGPSLAHKDMPAEARWSSMSMMPWVNTWENRVRDSVHMYWTRAYEADYDGGSYNELAPIRHLVWSSTRLSGHASIMVERLDDSFSWEVPEYLCEVLGDHPPRITQRTSKAEEFIHTYKQLPHGCLVVMQVIVVHADVKTASATRLFGLLGDARIQIVDMSEEAKVDAFYKLAEECEHKNPVSIAQDFTRRSLESVKQRLRDLIVIQFGTEELVPLMRPATMFRLCTLMCNHPGLAHQSSRE